MVTDFLQDSQRLVSTLAKLSDPVNFIHSQCMTYDHDDPY